MKAKGVRILDEEYGAISVRLEDILDEIKDGYLFKWSILFLYGIGFPGEEESLISIQNEIVKLERGSFIDWEDLKKLGPKFHQIIDISIIGCKSSNRLVRYRNDQDMYNSCNYVIEMIDSGCWEVFSFNFKLIDRLSKKFKEIEFLEPNFPR